MAAFDDCFDPELGAACNRLAAWVEALPEGAIIDSPSVLSEDDLALILRRLYATRHSPDGGAHPAAASPGRASVPVTARG
ncbi:hypothetical protein [Sphingomonas sp.]|uniref:hypothetical protein n=1 Tax=Sphingomonas sp. TaxID=28214 RepID=UPI0031DF17E3